MAKRTAKTTNGATRRTVTLQQETIERLQAAAPLLLGPGVAEALGSRGTTVLVAVAINKGLEAVAAS